MARETTDRITVRPDQSASAGQRVDPSETAGSANRRSRRGKVTNVGGHRIVNYFELTEHELDKVQDDRDEGAWFYALAAFFAGLIVDTVRDLALSESISDTNWGLVVATLVISFVLMIFSWKYGAKKRGRAETYLQRIKDEHDFNQ